MDQNSSARALALVGPGRAGTALALALRRRGWLVRSVAGRSPDATSTRGAAILLGATPRRVGEAGRGSELVVLAPPDAAIGEVAGVVAPSLEPGALVVHLSGVAGLGALDELARCRPDVAVGVMHPLQSLPDAPRGARRLEGAWCAIEGPEAVAVLAVEVGMRPFRLPAGDRSRTLYHAAACIASNHLVALLSQVERLARETGVPFEAFLPLVRSTLENVAELGPAAALTGPVARGDTATVAAHLDALPAEERGAYRTGAAGAARLVGSDDPALDALLSGVVA